MLNRRFLALYIRSDKHSLIPNKNSGKRLAGRRAYNRVMPSQVNTSDDFLHFSVPCDSSIPQTQYEDIVGAV